MTHSAPYYVYDQKEIKHACKTLQSNLPGIGFLYSVKANPFKPVLRTIAGEGFGADAASLREVEISLQSGIKPEDIFYSAPGKTEADIRGALGQCVLIADSIHELQLIERIADEEDTETEIGIRIHPDFTMDGTPASACKFGIGTEDLPVLARLLPDLPHLKIRGIHIHLKSQVLDTGALSGYYLNVMKEAIRIRDLLHIELTFVNFGSGIGIVYDPASDHPVDLSQVNRAFDSVRRMNQGLNARLLIETGRFVICKAGRYITPVIDKKESHGTTFLIVPNGLNGFMRPAIVSLLGKVTDLDTLPGMEPLFTCANEFQVRVLNDTPEQEKVSVVGNLCTALDVIAENITINKAEIGDLIEITNAGSYAYSLSPLAFASQDPPGQYLITEKGQWIDN